MRTVCLALALGALAAAGCVTRDFLGLADTARLLNASGGDTSTARSTKSAPTCFLAQLPRPSRTEPPAPVKLIVQVNDRRPEYKNYAPLAFVFLIPFAHGEVPGVPPATILGAEDKCIDYRHVVGLLVAKHLRASSAVLDARYVGRPTSVQSAASDLRLSIRLDDLHTDNLIFSYGLGPFCGVAWILGLPLGKTGLQGSGSWELVDQSGKVAGRGVFAVDEREIVGVYYSTTQQAYSPDGGMGKSMNGVVNAISEGVIATLRHQPVTEK